MPGSPLPRPSSCGGAEVVGCGPSGYCCQTPVELVERALLGLKLRRNSSTLPELCELERERLDPPNESDKLTSRAARFGLI
jgi:hypothetical protein